MGWWNQASKDQKLEQILAGRELKMTFHQIGLSLGTSGGAISCFISDNNLSHHFNYERFSKANIKTYDRTFSDVLDPSVQPLDYMTERLTF